MAKRKAARKTITRYVKAGRKRVKSFSSKPESVILPAALYGAARQKVAVALSPFLSKIPGGQIADELGMGLVSYMVAKKGKGMVKKIGLAGLTIEAAQAGQQLAAGGFNMGSTKASNSGVFLS